MPQPRRQQGPTTLLSSRAPAPPPKRLQRPPPPTQLAIPAGGPHPNASVSIGVRERWIATTTAMGITPPHIRDPRPHTVSLGGHISGRSESVATVTRATQLDTVPSLSELLGSGPHPIATTPVSNWMRSAAAAPILLRTTAPFTRGHTSPPPSASGIRGGLEIKASHMLPREQFHLTTPRRGSLASHREHATTAVAQSKTTTTHDPAQRPWGVLFDGSSSNLAPVVRLAGNKGVSTVTDRFTQHTTSTHIPRGSPGSGSLPPVPPPTSDRGKGDAATSALPRPTIHFSEHACGLGPHTALLITRDARTSTAVSTGRPTIHIVITRVLRTPPTGSLRLIAPSPTGN